MAKRPVFCAIDHYPYYEEQMIDFTFYSGFAVVQKQKSIESLHQSFIEKNPGKRVLEVSTKSLNPVGNKLSAFHLQIDTPVGKRYLENVFQSSKVFGEKGPFTDLLDKQPIEAKKDERIRNSGNITEFRYFDKTFPTNPKDYYYNWIYSRALTENLDRVSDIFSFDAFTDIEFNPEKSINCQARTVAIVVGLYRAGKLNEAMQNEEEYLRIVYGQQAELKQMSLF